MLVEPRGPKLPSGHGVPIQAPAPVVLVKVPDLHWLHAFAKLPVEPSGPNWPIGQGEPLQLVERAEKAHIPDGHGEHVASLALALPAGPNVPAAQPATPGEPKTATKHEEEAVVFEKRPGAQGVQVAVEMETAPGVPKVPALQGDPEQMPRPVEEARVPGKQREHVASCGFVEPRGPTLPRMHGVPMQAVDPGESDHVPEGHWRHTGFEEPAAAYVPAGQMLPVQFVEPAVDVWPGGHGVHDVAPAAAKKPALHCVHEASMALAAPRLPTLPGLQGVPVHAPLPVLEENVPGRQMEHVAATLLVEPSGPNEPRGHLLPLHEDSKTWPTCVPQVPLGQRLHVCVPNTP